MKVEELMQDEELNFDVFAIYGDRFYDLPFICTYIEKKMYQVEDANNLFDVVSAITKLKAVIEVFARDEQIHPGYALEKLESAQGTLKCVIEYFKSKVGDE